MLKLEDGHGSRRRRRRIFGDVISVIVGDNVFIQPTDPGAVGANAIWIDTSLGTNLDSNARMYTRNAGNTGWDLRAGGLAHSFFSGAIDYSILPAPQLINNAFTTIQLESNFDLGSNWDDIDSHYIVPLTGVYDITSRVRFVDGTGAFGFGQGVHTSNIDGTWFNWAARIGITISGNATNRLTSVNRRIAFFNAGDHLRLYAYVDTNGGGPVALANSELLITLLYPQDGYVIPTLMTLSDPFSDPDGTLLQNHVFPTLGANWIRDAHTNNASYDMRTGGIGKVVSTANTINGDSVVYRVPIVPATPDITVKATVWSDAGATEFLELYARGQGGNLLGDIYIVRLDPNANLLKLIKRISGVETVLDSHAYSIGDGEVVYLQIVGDNLSYGFDTTNFNTIVNSAITATGAFGMGCSNTTGGSGGAFTEVTKFEAEFYH